MSSFRFTYLLTGTGWSEGRIVVGDKLVVATASYLSDALGDLLRAVIEIANGARDSRATWEEEPGEYQWIFHREGDQVQLRLFDFTGAFLLAPDDDEAAVVLDTECGIDDFVNAFVSAARRVLDEYGEQGYAVIWHRYPFPRAELRTLEAWLWDNAQGRSR